jgi:hypothetical protein
MIDHLHSSNSSVSTFTRHCEERLEGLGRTNKVRTVIRSQQATKQSPFTTLTHQRFSNTCKHHFTTNTVPGDCFADLLTANVITTKLFATLRLAMTNVNFVGCVLRTATWLAKQNNADCKHGDGAPSAPYTFTARFL